MQAYANVVDADQLRRDIIASYTDPSGILNTTMTTTSKMYVDFATPLGSSILMSIDVSSSPDRNNDTGKSSLIGGETCR